jgi:Asp-tRNA(Asn)/Glu-tRNA(Gln) amidotransferase B subunit
MSFDVDKIAQNMISAAKGVVDEKWPATREYFESESKMYAQRLASVAKMYANGIISEKRAKEHIALQNEAWETTLLAINGLSQILVEEALNAAIKVIRDAVNKAIGFALL